jgi:hypothetical protein
MLRLYADNRDSWHCWASVLLAQIVLPNSIGDWDVSYSKNTLKTDKNNNLENDVKIVNTINGMYTAQLQSFGIDRQAVDDMAMRFGNTADDCSLFRRLVRSFYRIYGAYEMRKLERGLAKQVDNAEQIWAKMLKQSHSYTGFYTLDKSVVETLKDGASQAKNDLDAMERSLTNLRMIFPHQVDRMLPSLARLRQIQCDYFPAAFPATNPERLKESYAEYHRGELLSLEALKNGVQGVR